VSNSSEFFLHTSTPPCIYRYEDDVSWYSDDHGASWALSTPALAHLDEVVVVALPSGRVLLNARTDHYNASCDCRAFTSVVYCAGLV
jgi:hypothetical protein